MDLLQHFIEEKKAFIVLGLKDGEKDAFLKKLPLQYLDCYIPDNELQARIKSFSSTKEKELLEILPSEGSIKSGDFGEMLSYLLIRERNKHRKVDGPKKWRWKQEKNVAAPYTDVILFFIDNNKKPTKDDLLISVESKMKSTPGKDTNPVQNAINGSEKDYVSRIAHSLSWLRKKYKEESLKAGADIPSLIALVDSMERFINSETTGEYTKELIAVAHVDKDYLDDELKKSVVLPSVNGTKLEVIIVSIAGLKTIYEEVFKGILKL